jgi:hypothetical protein
LEHKFSLGEIHYCVYDSEGDCLSSWDTVEEAFEAKHKCNWAQVIKEQTVFEEYDGE